MPEYAVTVLGADRPGIIADTTEILADLGLNLTDSTMTRLRGHFAMTLICAGDVTAATIDGALAPLAVRRALVATVREVGPDGDVAAPGEHYLLTVHGADRLGIVTALARVVAEAGGNITDLTTRLVGRLYVLVAEVDLPATAERQALGNQLRAVAGRLGVEATLRSGEADLL
ncbi:MAG: amino acid-binding protein [Dactylosporangium sp.]|nr:amino acid-binding protein [Dactylosporangium sp.]NNJ63006.1 amino acid-binding protein [Dactylosporangium sp.]